MCNIVKITLMFAKSFKRMLAILHYFATHEIMRLTNGFMEFNKEFWLLQALTILKHSTPIDM